MGYRLPKYGADGKWSNSGETYEALLSFQKSCKAAFEGVKKNGTAGNLKPVEHFQSIEPTGSLDQRTYAALQKEKTKKVNVNYNNTTPKKVENEKKGTGKDNTLVDSFTSGFKGFFTNQYEYYKGKIQKAYTDPLEAAKENFKEAIIPPTYKIQMGIVNNIKENAELVLSGDLNKIVEHGGESIAEMVETGALALISGAVAKIAGKVTAAKMPEGTSKVGAELGTSFGKMGTLVENPSIKVNWDAYAEHGLERMAKRGVTQEMVNSWVANGKALQQGTNKYLFVTQEGAAVVTQEGKLVTTYSSKFFMKI